MKKSILLTFAIGVASVSQAQVIVYENMTNMAVASYRMASGATSSLEMGDEVTLGQTGTWNLRSVNTIMQTQTTGLGTYNFDVLLRVRALDGTGGAPGTILQAVNYAIRGLGEGAWNFTFPGLNVNIPQTVAVTFALTRQGGNTGGVGFQYNAATPTVGFSDPTFFWRENSAGSGTYGRFSFGGTNANLALRLNAVPEPSSMAAMALGLGAIAARRRRKK
jgi:hypothetical protein